MNDMLSEVFDVAVGRERTRAKRLVELHDRHDPRAIQEIQQVYMLASQKLDRAANDGAKARRRKALAALRELDRAGLSCEKCAPESACELEERS